VLEIDGRLAGAHHLDAAGGIRGYVGSEIVLDESEEGILRLGGVGVGGFDEGTGTRAQADTGEECLRLVF
jgi:hypothetical protein